jgi:hypothetical protein
MAQGSFGVRMNRRMRNQVSSSDRQAALRLDYQVTIDIIKLLTDIRFRCLVFVTAVIALSGVVLSATSVPAMRIGVGLVGVISTLGIAVYELRNSQLYEAAIHRAKALERAMNMTKAGLFEVEAGLFSERPAYAAKKTYRDYLERKKRGDLAENDEPALLVLWWVPIKHDRALGLIYSGAVGGWVFLLAYALMSLPAPAERWPVLPASAMALVAALLAVGCFVQFALRFWEHDKQRYKPHPYLVAPST